jgi:hypothetical protein
LCIALVMRAAMKRMRRRVMMDVIANILRAH